MRPSVLVAYATKHGHTRRIAEHAAETLRERGLEVELCDLGERGADPWPSDHAGVLLAASIHAGHHQSSVTRWARAHATSLALRPTAFASVSLTAADDTEEARASTRAMIDELSDESGWTPTLTLAVPGALQYREYDLATRVLMRLIARHHGQPTDPADDVDYTDWKTVARFAGQLADAVERAPRQPLSLRREART